MIERTLKATHTLLFGSTALAAEVGTNIHYARGPVTSTWPQVIYFDVSSRMDPVIDYDKVTVQVSAWSADKFQALRMQRIVHLLFSRFTGTVDVGGGEEVQVNWTDMVEAAALPQADPQLYGYEIRFEMRTRGANIGA